MKNATCSGRVVGGRRQARRVAGPNRASERRAPTLPERLSPASTHDRKEAPPGRTWRSAGGALGASYATRPDPRNAGQRCTGGYPGAGARQVPYASASMPGAPFWSAPSAVVVRSRALTRSEKTRRKSFSRSRIHLCC